jgi:hypothetical protein
VIVEGMPLPATMTVDQPYALREMASERRM